MVVAGVGNVAVGRAATGTASIGNASMGRVWVGRLSRRDVLVGCMFVGTVCASGTSLDGICSYCFLPIRNHHRLLHNKQDTYLGRSFDVTTNLGPLLYDGATIEHSEHIDSFA